MHGEVDEDVDDGAPEEHLVCAGHEQGVAIEQDHDERARRARQGRPLLFFLAVVVVRLPEDLSAKSRRIRD